LIAIEFALVWDSIEVAVKALQTLNITRIWDSVTVAIGASRREETSVRYTIAITVQL
jgi:hypothetical protein